MWDVIPLSYGGVSGRDGSTGEGRGRFVYCPSGAEPERTPLFARLGAARRNARFRTYKPNLYYIRYRIELQERRIEILTGGGLRVLGKYAIVDLF